MKKFRDIEQLSAYLDGQLSPSDFARLESRIFADPELDSVLSDLRLARGILRKLPARKAPRNFTLTRKMVGLKPPLPRTFSFFRFSTAFATFLLMLTFAANSILPRMSFGAGAPMMAQEAYGISGCDEPCSPSAMAAATEAPVVPSMELAAAPTETSEDTARVAETPAAKEAGNLSAAQDQPQVQSEAIIPSSWQIGLLIIGLLSAALMFGLRQSAIRKWK
jgi:anti-sigma factor RsiW